MRETFDIAVDALTAAHLRFSAVGSVIEPLPQPPSPNSRVDEPRGARSFYLETFGCQMNAHDSEKVAGVLLARGYRQGGEAGRGEGVSCTTRVGRGEGAQKRL